MKGNLKVGLNIVCAILLLTSCANSYIHNSFNTPTFNDSVKTSVSTGIGLRHLEMNVAHAPRKNMFIMASGYVGNKSYDFALEQFYGDVNVGFQKPISKKTSFGTYYTVGAGYSDYKYLNDGLWGNKFIVNSNYLKHSGSIYIKKNQGIFRGFLAMRSSFVQYNNYEYIERSNSGGILAGSFSYDTTKSTSTTDFLLEPCMGFDLVNKHGLSFGLQNLLTFSHNDFLKNKAYIVTVLRFNIAYNFKSKKRKKAY